MRRPFSGRGEPIVRVRPAVVMDHGSEFQDWDNAESVELLDWILAPGASVEDLQRGELIRVDWTAYGPYDADVTGTDKIRLPSGDYSVIGEPERWKHPMGKLAGTKLLLQKWAVR